MDSREILDVLPLCFSAHVISYHECLQCTRVAVEQFLQDLHLANSAESGDALQAMASGHAGKQDVLSLSTVPEGPTSLRYHPAAV